MVFTRLKRIHELLRYLKTDGHLNSTARDELRDNNRFNINDIDKPKILL